VGSGFGLDVEHALLHEDDVVARVGVPAAVHRMVGAVGNIGFTGHFPQARFAVLPFAIFVHGLVFPEREDFLTQFLLVFLGNIERILGAGGDGIQLGLHPAPFNVRGEGAGARCAVGRAHDEFVILDDQRSGLAATLEGLAAHENGRHAGVFLGHLGDGARTVNADARDHLQEVFLELDVTLGRGFGNTRAFLDHGHGFGRFGLENFCGYALENFLQRGPLLRSQVLCCLSKLIRETLKIHYASSSYRDILIIDPQDRL